MARYPPASRFATSDFLSDHRFEVWNEHTGERLPDVPLVIEGTHGVHDLIATRDGTRIHVGCAGETVKVIDATTRKTVTEYRGLRSFDRLAITPDAAVPAASAGDPDLRPR